jgi:hypothetical protein
MGGTSIYLLGAVPYSSQPCLRVIGEAQDQNQTPLSISQRSIFGKALSLRSKGAREIQECGVPCAFRSWPFNHLSQMSWVLRLIDEALRRTASQIEHVVRQAVHVHCIQRIQKWKGRLSLGEGMGLSKVHRVSGSNWAQGEGFSGNLKLD